MSESTEELDTAVQGMSEALAEVGTQAEQLNDHATELSEEAAGHGWHAMARRMQEIAEALEVSAGQITTSKQASENASQALGSINDTIPAPQVVEHLTTSTAQLGEATTALEGAVEKADEARTAAEEIGQEGMMQGTIDLHDRLVEVHETITQHQNTSKEEQAAAEAYAKEIRGN